MENCTFTCFRGVVKFKSMSTSHSSSHSARHDHGHHSHHGHHHGHDHHGGHIGFAFLLNFSFGLIELIGGAMVGSMAIVAGAIHDLGDSVSLGLAWGLERFANRRKDSRFNFGYRRFSLLSALFSGVVISASSGVIIYESIHRFKEPESPSGSAIVVLAFLGLFINGLAAWKLSLGSTQNERILTWHSIEDMLSWVIVLAGGALIAIFETKWLDPLLAIGLAFFVLFNVLRHLKNTAYLFLQGRPADFDETVFLSEALAVPGLEKIDRLAVWSLDGQSSILSARLHLHAVRDPNEIERVKDQVRQIAAAHHAEATLETCLLDGDHHHVEEHESVHGHHSSQG